MDNSLRKFHGGMKRCQNLVQLYGWSEANTTGVVHASDLLRAALVLGVAVFDAFLVDLCCVAFVEIIEKKRPVPARFHKIKLPVYEVLNGSGFCHASAYRESIQYRSYQRPDKIRDYVYEISDIKIWPMVAKRTGCSESDITQRLGLIVDRRNCISHSGDADPTYGGHSLFPIYPKDIQESLSFLSKIGDAIKDLLAQDMHLEKVT